MIGFVKQEPSPSSGAFWKMGEVCGVGEEKEEEEEKKRDRGILTRGSGTFTLGGGREWKRHSGSG
jgi:hypothetical protein